MSGVVVTGGASVIGLESAKPLIADGRAVSLVDIAPQVVSVAESLGVHGVVVDVSDTGSMAVAVEQAAAAMGGIDGLVHAAGRVLPEPVGAFTAESWDAVVDVNLRAQALLSQLLLPYFEKALADGAAPSIVGISSIEGLVGNPFIPAYCASKAGLLGLTRSMAGQLGPLGIRVNAVCPGFIETPMLADALAVDEVKASFVAAAPLGRLGQPEEIGATVAFLMSSKASFITGTQIVVDGGVTARHA
ncbi:MAG: SDR family oxidoreductase [Mycobacterium sp.]|nr:SDR family oxidoreductase [Mycobacterium sp.]